MAASHPESTHPHTQTHIMHAWVKLASPFQLVSSVQTTSAEDHKCLLTVIPYLA